MTVFGFGRLGLESYLELVPAQFTIGFAETAGGSGVDEEVTRTIESAHRDLHVEVGRLAFLP
jgi:hypothetical protein